MSDVLLSGFGPEEQASLRRVLENEANPASGGGYRKPTWHELWEAGWIEPPYCLWPLSAVLIESLLRELRDAESWVVFGPNVSPVLRALQEREPGLLKCRVTKRDGEMWRLTQEKNHEPDTETRGARGAP